MSCLDLVSCLFFGKAPSPLDIKLFFPQTPLVTSTTSIEFLAMMEVSSPVYLKQLLLSLPLGAEPLGPVMSLDGWPFSFTFYLLFNPSPQRSSCLLSAIYPFYYLLPLNSHIDVCDLAQIKGEQSCLILVLPPSSQLQPPRSSILQFRRSLISLQGYRLRLKGHPEPNPKLSSTAYSAAGDNPLFVDDFTLPGDHKKETTLIINLGNSFTSTNSSEGKECPDIQGSTVYVKSSFHSQ